MVHKTVPLQVWVDVDLGIVDVVRYLNSIPGVRTYTSCQGTLHEGGPIPYRPYVDASWTDETEELLKQSFEIEVLGASRGILYVTKTNWQPPSAI